MSRLATTVHEDHRRGRRVTRDVADDDRPIESDESTGFDGGRGSHLLDQPSAFSSSGTIVNRSPTTRFTPTRMHFID
jgi:hypothetical protein